VATSVGIAHDRKLQNTLLDFEKIIIAKVEGPAVGLGCSLALLCDFVYATHEAVFADPHVSVGLVAGDGGAFLWPQLIGYARARRYLLTGEPISGLEAAAIGLITESVAADQLDEKVAKMAARIARGATHAIKWTKASINAGLKVTANAVIDRSAAYENMAMMLDDHRIALEAFQEKRKPVFTGK
jgi:enoyl-CoA hydratase